jgi:mannose-6-phosphate isomerase-like protein (cupin superfamily)
MTASRYQEHANARVIGAFRRGLSPPPAAGAKDHAQPDARRPLRHDGREYGLVISGTLQADVGFESYELGPGDSIAFDSSTPHEYLNKTGDPVHAVWVVVHSEPGRA